MSEGSILFLAGVLLGSLVFLAGYWMGSHNG